MKFARPALLVALTAAALPAALLAQVAVGAKVTGSDGNPIGTVVTAEGGIVTVDTGTYKAPLPENAFGKKDDGFVLSVTKAQIDQMMAQQAAAMTAKRDAALVAGAPVVSAKGAPVGAIKSVDGDAVVLDSPEGVVALKREHFAVNATGALMALFTADQITAAAGGSAEATAEAAAPAETN